VYEATVNNTFSFKFQFVALLLALSVTVQALIIRLFLRKLPAVQKQTIKATLCTDGF
jgi:hypothetical protein